MDFRNEFLGALRAGKTDEDLLKIVRAHQAHLSNLREVYDVLQDIWMELGFDEHSDGSALQNTLEYVMEKIWYECPAAHSTD
jgi:hypothetical protein